MNTSVQEQRMDKTLLQAIDPDRWRPMWMGHKIKFGMLIAHLIFIAWCFSDEFSWTFLLVASPFLWFFISKMGMEIGYHRLWCHRSFTTKKWVEWLLMILGVASNAGSCLSWVAMHRVHHQKADRPGDPQNPHTHKRWQLWLTDFGDDWSTSPKHIKDLIHDPMQRFFHRNYFKLAIGYVVFWSLVSWYFASWYPILAAWSIPVITNFNLAGFLNAHFHRHGQKNWKPIFSYRNFDTKDDSLNSAVLNFFMAGSALHNNHHAYDSSYTFNVYRRWYEPDITGWFVKNVLATTVNDVHLPDPKKS